MTKGKNTNAFKKLFKRIADELGSDKSMYAEPKPTASPPPPRAPSAPGPRMRLVIFCRIE